VDDEPVRGAEEVIGVLDAMAIEIDRSAADEGVGAGSIHGQPFGEVIGESAAAVDVGGGELARSGHGAASTGQGSSFSRRGWTAVVTSSTSALAIWAAS